MCNERKLFTKFECLQKTQEVTLGDGYALVATGQGTVYLEITLPDGKTNRCILHSVLFLPKLSYNLLSVTKVSEHGKVIRFDDAGCQILNKCDKCIAVATKLGNLYYLQCKELEKIQLSMAEKERLWHRRYGHLGEQNLQKLASKRLVGHFDYDITKEVGFCETCIGGKHHKSQFQNSNSTR